MLYNINYRVKGEMKEFPLVFPNEQHLNETIVQMMERGIRQIDVVDFNNTFLYGYLCNGYGYEFTSKKF